MTSEKGKSSNDSGRYLRTLANVLADVADLRDHFASTPYTTYESALTAILFRDYRCSEIHCTHLAHSRSSSGSP